MRADGSEFPVELSLALPQSTDNDELIFYGFVRDISERRRGEEQLTFMAYHDPLTELPNRILAEEQIELALARARRSDGAVALMFVDLDGFKEVNDRLGHAAGDQLLAGVAARLNSVLRGSDLLARLGGDEFLVLLADLPPDAAVGVEHVGSKLLDSLREPFDLVGRKLRTGASIGVSLYPADADDTETLLRHADAAMYQAKAAGGRRIAFHERSDAILSRRASLSAQLRRAMVDRELELHYQPVWTVDGTRGESSASRPCCAGSTPSTGCCGPTRSSTPPSRAWPATSCRRGSCVRSVARHTRGRRRGSARRSASMSLTSRSWPRAMPGASPS